ncbi:MAG TPA: SRPBCC family protein [Gaiellales bacterium]|nr:SRPBCC family protein [Gaiellales bacterium]
MSVDVLTQVVIDRPRAEVAAYAADPDNATRWYKNITAVEWQTARPMAVGSRVAFVAEFLGRRLEYAYEIADLEPESRLVMRTADGPFPMETTYTWEDADGGGTLMTLENRGSPSGFGRLATPFISRSMRRANRKDLELLKQILESAGGVPADDRNPTDNR